MPQQFPAMFIADSAGLDFLNSVATPVDVPIDWIADGEGLLVSASRSILYAGDADSIRKAVEVAREALALGVPA